jgi:molybdenum cofactor cytidylyltransferase
MFALVPAAGESARMGWPKLLLPVAGQPMILHTVAAWQRSKVDLIVVVVRPEDDELAKIVRAAGVQIVVPAAAPPDMKASLQVALRHIELTYSPAAGDAFLVAPADMPRLSSKVIDLLIHQHGSFPERILVPELAGRRGHPALFPWAMAKQVQELGPDEGLDAVVHRNLPLEIPCESVLDDHWDPFTDVDTPSEYRELTNGHSLDGQRASKT